MSNTATMIAAIFGNDGTTFDVDGMNIEGTCEDRGAKKETRGDATRYPFGDGSAIVIAGGGWDVEGDEPFSWAM